MLYVLLLVMMHLPATAPGHESRFTASTPAGKTVRNFLGISEEDSVDFIRWKLKIADNETFELKCSYGIGKANTNGFVDEKRIEVAGTAVLREDLLTLRRQNKILRMRLLSPGIIHPLYEDGTLMVGNGGWSYTLNAETPVTVSTIMAYTKNIAFADSITFDGRTPCRGMEELMDNKTRRECYKKKWRVSLYRDHPGSMSGTYAIGTAQRRTGKWKLEKLASGKTFYSLDLNNGNTLDLYQADENVAYIMDGKGGLMIGDEDFSYALNRKGYTDH